MSRRRGVRIGINGTFVTFTSKRPHWQYCQPSTLPPRPCGRDDVEEWAQRLHGQPAEMKWCGVAVPRQRDANRLGQSGNGGQAAEPATRGRTTTPPAHPSPQRARPLRCARAARGRAAGAEQCWVQRRVSCALLAGAGGSAEVLWKSDTPHPLRTPRALPCVVPLSIVARSASARCSARSFIAPI